MTNLMHKYFRQHLEDALSLGRPLMLEDVGTYSGTDSIKSTAKAICGCYSLVVTLTIKHFESHSL